MTPEAHLLIVDDDERIRGLLQKFLMRNGYLVTTARDADKASRMMRLHLKHIQEHLDLSSRKRPQLDLVTILKR